MQVKFDGVFNLASGKWRKETSWKNRDWRWSELLEKLSRTFKTQETYKEYIAFKPDKQTEVKDIGGFVGGYITGGNRLKESIISRQLITLDLDFAKPGFWDTFKMTEDYAACIYSTHKHCPDKPRLRLLIPLTEEIQPDKYQAVSRKLAEMFGFDQFDTTTFQPERLMYWPSTASDAEYVFKWQDGEWLDPNDVLAMYRDWRNISDWPGIDTAVDVGRILKEKKDPKSLKGVQGAFNRAFSVTGAIVEFLSEEYEETAMDHRFTYKKGSGFAGLIVHEGDFFCTSHHGTDPAGGDDKSWSAWDLVRLHKFGLMDSDAKDKTPIHQLPSNKAMKEFARKVDAVRLLMAAEDFEENSEGYGGVTEEDPDQPTDKSWMKLLEKSEDGRNLSTAKNILIVMKNEPMLAGRIAKDLFDQRLVLLKNVPWRKIKVAGEEYTNDDDSCLRNYLSILYNIKGKDLINDAMTEITMNNTVHGLKDWLEGLQWGGSERLDTLLIDYLGAKDSPYIRAVTRKALVAAVARIFEPGCKYETMPVIAGEQGTGKSTLLNKLGGKWFSDSFSFKHLKDPSRASLQLQGVWFFEIAEMSGMKMAEVEEVKAFIGVREDRYKVVYKPRTEPFPRQCTFWGTTNSHAFLKDLSGNRRFWPVDTFGGIPTRDVFKDFTEREREQVWAEAVHYYRKGEPLHLPEELLDAAKKAQKEFTDFDARVGFVQAFLDKKITENWGDKNIFERKNFLSDNDFESLDKGTVTRQKVCIQEIWAECFGRNLADLDFMAAKSIRNIMAGVEGWVKAKGNMRFGIYSQQKGYVREISADIDEEIEKSPKK